MILFTTSSHNLDLCYDSLLNYIQQTVNTLLFHYVLPCIIYSNHLSVQGLIIETFLTDRSYTSLSTVLITFYLITLLHAKLNLMHKKITTHKLSLQFHAYNLDGNQFRRITSGWNLRNVHVYDIRQNRRLYQVTTGAWKVLRQLEWCLVLLSAKQIAINALTQVPEAPNVIQSQHVNSFMIQNYTAYIDVGY